MRGGLDGDDVLIGFGAGFEEQATFVGFIVATGEGLGVVVFVGIVLVGIGGR